MGCWLTESRWPHGVPEDLREMRYLALLRGINVGGKNIIKMAALKACFEKMGYADVATYIQSGNVLFSGAGKKRDTIVSEIERALSKQFNYESRIVLVTKSELEKVVKNAPRGFGKDAESYRYDVAFLKKPLTALEALKNVRTRDGVDKAYAGQGVLYFSRLTKRASQSYLSKIAQTPVYPQMTIRNWNTTTKLLAHMRELES
jgi:uncharacterized protein (DUF1697 family)